MNDIVYAVQRPGQGPVILNAYRSLRRVRFDRVSGFFAFASRKGAKLLIGAMDHSNPHWRTATKRWILSIDGGVTEPGALRYLLAQRKTEVFIPEAEVVLARNLRPIRRFHPKTMLLERNGASTVAIGIVVGSANLTCNGLCFGHEHAIVMTDTDGAGLSSLEGGVRELASVVEAATKIDLGFVDRYEAARPSKPTIPEEFEDTRTDQILDDAAVIPAEESAALASAQHLWVEVRNESKNRGRQEEGSQIDLKKGTRVFFGGTDKAVPKNTPIATFRVNFEHHSAMRNLRFGSNDMDKLDLPIPGQEGPPSYRNQTILFTCQGPNAYSMALGGAEQIQEWKNRSKKIGALFQMRGGREYGVF